MEIPVKWRRTHKDFYARSQKLARYQRRKGMHVITVKTEDIYDEFNSDVFHPQAIRDLLSYAYKNWKPLIANEGQVDEQVRYYAKTFSGTVYVTREGEIMYALPKYEKEVKDGCTPGDGEGMAGKVRGTGVYGAVLSCFYNTETIASLSEPLQCRGAVPAPSPSSPLRAPSENRHTKSRVVVLKEYL